MNPCTYGQLVYNKGEKITQLMKDNLFNIWFWDDWTAICQKMKLEHAIILHIKINSKWIKDLNLRPETIKLLEENISGILDGFNQSKILYDLPTSSVQFSSVQSLSRV